MERGSQFAATGNWQQPAVYGRQLIQKQATNWSESAKNFAQLKVRYIAIIMDEEPM